MEKEGAGKKVLVVDDKEDSRVLVGKVLKLRGYEVIGAGTGEDAITMAQTELPDLILMDVHQSHRGAGYPSESGQEAQFVP